MPTGACSKAGAKYAYDKCGRRCSCVKGKLVNCCRVRKDYAALNQKEKLAYINAVLTLSKDPIYKPRYDALIDKYRQSYKTVAQTCTTTKSQFFPFIRYFLMEYENLLREVDCRITIPYWDWTAFPLAPYSSPVWDNAYGFGDSAGPYGCVTTGPFHFPDFITTPSAGGKCLKRNYHKGFYPSRDIIERDILPLPANEFKFFHYMLQMFISINVQCFIGGTSCSVHAANEPAFILHLAHIDFIFNRWQGLGDGRDKVHYFTDKSPLVLSGGLVVSQFCDNSKLPGGVSICYTEPVYLQRHAPALLSSSKVRMQPMSCVYQKATAFLQLTDDQTNFLKKQCIKDRLYRMS